MMRWSIKERCAILHRQLVAKGISEKHVRMMMDELIPILRTSDALAEKTLPHLWLDSVREPYEAAWKRITGE